MDLLSTWSFEPPVLIGLAIAALLYWRGLRGLSLGVVGRRPAMRPWQVLAFYAGLLTVVIALESPIDGYNGELFWAHMLQHLLLIMVAAPLLALGDPAVPLVRGIPLGIRRRALGAAARQAWVHRLGHVLSRLGRPAPVFVIFIVDLYLWHWNTLFTLTLQNQAVHDLEHICFIGSALLLWSQIIEVRSMRSPLTYGQRAIYSVLTAFSSNLLAMYFVFAPRPVYGAYAAVAHRPFGISAVADQQLAGAMMWVPVLFLFGGAFAVCVFKWLGEEEAAGATGLSPAGSYSVLLAPGDGSVGQ